MEYTVKQFEYNKGILTITVGAFDISFDVPIVNNRFIMGDDLKNYIQNIVLNPYYNRILDLQNVTNVVEFVNSEVKIYNVSAPKEPIDELEKNLNSYIRHIFSEKQREFNFVSDIDILFALNGVDESLKATSQSLINWKNALFLKLQEIITNAKQSGTIPTMQSCIDLLPVFGV